MTVLKCEQLRHLCHSVFTKLNFRKFTIVDLCGILVFIPKLNKNLSWKRCLLGNRDDTVVRAFASRQCGPGSILGPSVTCLLSLLLVLVPALRLHLRILWFSSLHRKRHSKFQFDPCVTSIKYFIYSVSMNEGRGKKSESPMEVKPMILRTPRRLDVPVQLYAHHLKNLLLECSLALRFCGWSFAQARSLSRQL